MGKNCFGNLKRSQSSFETSFPLNGKKPSRGKSEQKAGNSEFPVKRNRMIVNHYTHTDPFAGRKMYSNSCWAWTTAFHLLKANRRGISDFDL